MIDKTFIENQSEVQEILSSLIPTDDEAGYCCEILMNPSTGEKWEKYTFEFENDHSEGIGLRKYPYPSLEKAIEIALSSHFDDEINGASAFLYEYDSEGEFLESLVEEMEHNVHSLTTNRFEIIYNRAELYDNINKRSTAGKHYTEVTKDYEYFLVLGERIESLKKRIMG